jgi:hypothetical protein
VGEKKKLTRRGLNSGAINASLIAATTSVVEVVLGGMKKPTMNVDRSGFYQARQG